MAEDTFRRDLTIDYDAPVGKRAIRADGHAGWPILFSALPMGFRPLTIELSAPSGKGPHPLVIYIHGGGWAWGYPTMLTNGLTGMEIERHLLEAGFAVAKISYRLSAEARFPAQLHDCKAAVRYLRRHSAALGLDSSRFAALGESAGGHLAALLGLTGNRPELEGAVGVAGFSSAVQAVVCWYPVTEFLKLDMQRQSHVSSFDPDNGPEAWLLGARPERVPDIARAASPVTYASATAPPFLIQHGTSDRIVPIEQGRALRDALQTVGAAATLIEIQGADHCFWGVDPTGIVREATCFLHEALNHKLSPKGLASPRAPHPG